MDAVTGNVSFNDMQDLSCSPSNGNISQDPLFVDAAGGDGNGSQIIDMGADEFPDPTP